MSKPAEFCKIIFDDDGRAADFVCRRLQMEATAGRVAGCLGFLIGGRLRGGVVFSDLRPGHDVWISIWTDDKRWCSRRVLQTVFGFAFDFWHCRRINALIDTNNRRSLKLAEGVGFRREGKLRQYRENGRDVYVLGLLKNECNYFKEKKHV